jgi:hypothetical protein
MTENSEQFLAESHNGDRTEAILLELPPGLARLLHQHRSQAGQSLAEAILAILQSALAQPAGTDSLNPQSDSAIRLLEARLRDLESLLPRLERLEGKWIAF